MDDRQLYRASGAPGLKEALAVALVRQALAVLADQSAADPERAYARAVLAAPVAAALRAALVVLVAGAADAAPAPAHTNDVPDDATLAAALATAWPALVAAS